MILFFNLNIFLYLLYIVNNEAEVLLSIENLDFNSILNGQTGLSLFKQKKIIHRISYAISYIIFTSREIQCYSYIGMLNIFTLRFWCASCCCLSVSSKIWFLSDTPFIVGCFWRGLLSFAPLTSTTNNVSRLLLL